jgi:TusA-related sulfurtransferase
VNSRRLVVESLDITAEQCPMTFVKVKVALHELAKGDVLEVLLRGEEPLRNIPFSLKQEGHDVLSIEHLSDDIHKVIVKKC